MAGREAERLSNGSRLADDFSGLAASLAKGAGGADSEPAVRRVEVLKDNTCDSWLQRDSSAEYEEHKKSD